MLVAIAGGIGSGKSVVSRIVSALGYPVYDCDSRASVIMDTNYEIKKRLVADIHPDSVDENGEIDRGRISSIVFNDADALSKLNSIVHVAVKCDIARWNKETKNDLKFVETAILYQSGIDRMVDRVWIVVAPLDLRVERVMERNGMTRNQVLARIASQDQFTIETPHPYVIELENDSFTPLLPQIEHALSVIMESKI